MALTGDALQEFKPGTARGAEGFFRVGQTPAGQWWLLDPDGQPFFWRAVNEVRAAPDVPHDPVARLRSWGFNAIGAGSDPALWDEGLPFVAAVDFCAAGALIRAPGARLPDVFDPAWPQAAARRAAEVCGPLRDRRELLGWITDDNPGWAQPEGTGRPTLLQLCLSLEPTFAAYHAAWEFVLALHGGRLEALARSWAQPMANKAVVRELTRTEQGIASRGYLRDDARWSREFARRYFALTAAAIRQQDPHHLVLGCRCGVRGTASRGPGPAVLAECAYPALDVAWIDAEDLHHAPPGPVLAGDFTWVDERFIGPPGVHPPRGLTSVERMLRRGRLALARALRHPATVGYAWSRWEDGAGERPPLAGGLVHADGAEAREHTELLADFNSRAQTLRRLPAPAPSP